MKKNINTLIHIVTLIHEKIELIAKPQQCTRCSRAKKSGPFLTRTQAAAFVKVSLRTFDRLKKEGLIKAVRFGQTDFYREEDLQDAYKESVRKGRI